ncbi:MAG: hypothetical protein E6Q97_12660 [Desulfurellales bacterium]|nr:MAG: hypothetical protein E6Q97_12660 [Desulfurellales bacterium]
MRQILVAAEFRVAVMFWSFLVFCPLGGSAPPSPPPPVDAVDGWLWADGSDHEWADGSLAEWEFP